MLGNHLFEILRLHLTKSYLLMKSDYNIFGQAQKRDIFLVANDRRFNIITATKKLFQMTGDLTLLQLPKNEILKNCFKWRKRSTNPAAVVPNLTNFRFLL